MISEELPEALDGERIDRVVSMVTDCSRSRAAELVAAGEVELDGVAATKASTRVAAGQTLVVRSTPSEAHPTLEPDATVEFSLVHADEDLLVIDKPAGLVVHPGAGHQAGTLVHGLLARYPELLGVGEEHRPGIVHRLDRGTSGLMVVARSSGAYADLVEQLRERSVRRAYTALVWGHPEHPQGIVDAPIARSRRDPLRFAVSIDGREARTRYRLEATFTDPVEVALLDCELETGRTHQIRVHLASIGHPVVGDGAYGGARSSFELARPFLHARHLELRHPRTAEPLSFDAPLPADLVSASASLA